MSTNNFKYFQGQPYTLSGSGAIAGATSITLQAMLDIDGNVLTMSGTFGAKGFGTMEPGNGALEEQISFTGLTNNANGTVTLSGVSSVGFSYPYTETSGLAKTHAGSTTFVISNTAGFYNEVVAKNDDATLTGTLTFTTPNYPQVDNSATMPTLQAQLATKAYVDAVVITGAPNATTSVQGLVQLPTQAQVDAGTAAGSTGASLTPTPALLRSKLLSDYVADTGAADAYVITPSPAIAAYAVGQIFSFKATQANTTTSTVNVNAKGAKTIKKDGGSTNLQAGDILAGQIVMVEYDGTNFQMINPPAIGLPSIGSGQINEFLTTTDGLALSFGRTFNYQVFTGSGTWTKPTNLSGNEMVYVQAWGGGAGGAGVATGSAGKAGGGGGGGGYIEGKFRASDLGSTVTVTIGAGGAGGASGGNNHGIAGGNTTFGSLLTAYGGGYGDVDGANANTGAGGGGGGALSVGSNGSTATGGAGGSPGGGAANSASSGLGGGGGGSGTGAGGSSGWGGGGGAGGSNTTNAGGSSVYGGGGGGGGGQSNAGTAAGTSVFGGAGGAGGQTAAGSAGTAPSGGGGGAGNGSFTGGAGARGEIRVWTFY